MDGRKGSCAPLLTGNMGYNNKTGFGQTMLTMGH